MDLCKRKIPFTISDILSNETKSDRPSPRCSQSSSPEIMPVNLSVRNDIVLHAQKQLFEQQQYYAKLLQLEAWNWKQMIEQSHHLHSQIQKTQCHTLNKYPLPTSVRTLPGRPYPIPQCSKADLDKAGQKYRRNRTVYTENQLRGFERKFDTDKYLTNSDRQELARQYGVTQVQVKTWFQNRRMKWKKEVMKDKNAECPTKPKGRPKKNASQSSEPRSNDDTDSVEDSSQQQTERSDED